MRQCGKVVWVLCVCALCAMVPLSYIPTEVILDRGNNIYTKQFKSRVNLVIVHATEVEQTT